MVGDLLSMYEASPCVEMASTTTKHHPDYTESLPSAAVATPSSPSKSLYSRRRGDADPLEPLLTYTPGTAAIDGVGVDDNDNGGLLQPRSRANRGASSKPKFVPTAIQPWYGSRQGKLCYSQQLYNLQAKCYPSLKGWDYYYPTGDVPCLKGRGFVSDGIYGDRVEFMRDRASVTQFIQKTNGMMRRALKSPFVKKIKTNFIINDDRVIVYPKRRFTDVDLLSGPMRLYNSSVSFNDKTGEFRVNLSMDNVGVMRERGLYDADEVLSSADFEKARKALDALWGRKIEMPVSGRTGVVSVAFDQKRADGEEEEVMESSDDCDCGSSPIDVDLDDGLEDVA